jgi:hypothetical protein
MSAPSRYQLPNHVMQQRIAQSTVLLNIKSGEYFELNHSGAIILSGLLEGSGTAEISANLLQTFKVDAPRAHADIDALKQTLISAGLIETAA